MSVYVAGTGLAIPTPTSVADQVAAGAVNELVARRSGMTSVAIANDSGPQMAVRAAQDALARGGHDPQRCVLHLHASMSYGGYDLWSPASFIESRLGIRNALGLNVDQLSNGGLGAFELAATHVAAQSEGFALVTTGEKYSAPLIDRWSSDPGTVFGDGGTAVTLSASGGFAEVLAIASVADPDLEVIARADDPPADHPGAHRLPASLDAGRTALAAAMDVEEFLERVQDGQRRSYATALSSAGVAPSDVRWHVVPHLGLPKTRHQLLTPLDFTLETTTWEWGRTVGHLGGGDQFAGLHHLLTTGRLDPGDLCALHGVGGGFTWTTVVLRVLRHR